MIVGRWKFFVASAALALAPLTHAILAQAVVTGRVTGVGTGQPVADARIVVVGSPLGATSADDGRYTVRGVPSGTVQIQAFRVGFQPVKRTITVPATGSVTDGSP